MYVISSGVLQDDFVTYLSTIQKMIASFSVIPDTTR
jgi:hypothetical protein